MQTDYPITVLDVIDDNIRFNTAALRALREFAAAGPWRGLPYNRKQKFAALNRRLAKVYGAKVPDLRFGALDGGSSARSHYIPALHRIVLVGKLSVVTFLHEFAHARGLDERGACRWSINLFRRVFTKQYARLVHHGHMLLHPQSLPGADPVSEADRGGEPR